MLRFPEIFSRKIQKRLLGFKPEELQCNFFPCNVFDRHFNEVTFINIAQRTVTVEKLPLDYRRTMLKIRRKKLWQ